MSLSKEPQQGVSAYDLVFRVTDSETAVFEDINLTTEGNDGPLTDIEYSKGRSKSSCVSVYIRCRVPTI